MEAVDALIRACCGEAYNNSHEWSLLSDNDCAEEPLRLDRDKTPYAVVHQRERVLRIIWRLQSAIRTVNHVDERFEEARSLQRAAIVSARHASEGN